MPEETSWLYWHCSACGHPRIRGDQKVCPSCRHPQDHEERRAMEASVDDAPAAAEDVITDAPTLERVRGEGRADWWCNNCDKSVVFDRGACDRCGAPRDARLEEVEALATAAGVADRLREKGEDRALLVERHGAVEGREILAGRGAGSTRGLVEAAADLRGPSPKPRAGGGVGRAVLLGLALLVALGLVWWGLPGGGEVAGEVRGLAWTRSEVIERFTPERRSGWRGELIESAARFPTDGAGEAPGLRIVGCEERIHHYDQVPCGVERVLKSRRVPDGETCRSEQVHKTRKEKAGEDCRTTTRTCRSNSNGTRTCRGGDRVCEPRYRTVRSTETARRCQPRFRNEHYTEEVTRFCPVPDRQLHCDYDTHAWREVARAEKVGLGLDRVWPALPLTRFDRRVRTERLRVLVGYTVDKQVREHELPVDEAAFGAWRVGEPVRVTFDGDGAVLRVRRPGEA